MPPAPETPEDRQHRILTPAAIVGVVVLSVSVGFIALVAFVAALIAAMR